MFRKMRVVFLLVAGLMLSGTSLVQAQQPQAGGEAGDVYLKGYFAYTQAERLEQGGDPQGAMAKYQEAQALVGSVAKNYPAYQPEVVTYRLKMIEVALQRLSGKAAPAVPAVPKTAATPGTMPSVVTPPQPLAVPAPATPGGQQPMANPLDVINQQFQAMQKQNAELQNKLKLYEDGYTNALRERQKADQDRALLQQQMKDLNDRIEKLTKEGNPQDAQKLRNEAKMAAEMLALRDQQIAEKDKTIAPLQGQKKTLEGRLADLEKEVVELKKRDAMKPDDLKKLADENSRLKNELDAAKQQVETLKTAGEKKDQEIASLKTQIKTIQGDLAKLKEENTAYQNQVADLTVKLKEMNSELEGKSKPGKKSTAQNPSLAEENKMLRGIIMRELRHQERQRQAKELVIAEMKKMENASQQLMDHLEEMTSARIKISMDEEKLFTQPELKEIIAASGVRATLSAAGDKKKADEPADMKLLAAGDAAASSGDLKAAEKSYQDALRANPKNNGARLNLGALKLQQKKYDEAKTLLQKVLVQEPDNDLALYRLGVCQFQLGNLSEAVTDFEKSLAKNKDNARAHHYLGIITSRQGNRNRAESEFKQALAIDPNYGDAHFNLAVLYATASPPDWDQARQHYKDALERGIKSDPALEKLLNKETKDAAASDAPEKAPTAAAN